MADEPVTDTKQPETDRLQQLFKKLWGDKSELGRSVRKSAQEMFPDIALPEDAAETVVAPVKAELDGVKTQLKDALDRIAARDKRDSDMQAQIDLQTKIDAARHKYNLTDSGREKMLNRMQETGNVTDAEAAAAWVVSTTPKPEPSSSPTWLPQEANLFGFQKKEDEFEALHKDPRKYLDDQLRAFVRDPDKYTAETFGTA